MLVWVVYRLIFDPQGWAPFSPPHLMLSDEARQELSD